MDLIERAAAKEKKKKTGGSLVERAAQKVASEGGTTGIGGIGKPRDPSDMSERMPDPSSLNPVEEQPKKQFRGIGQAGTAKPKSDPAEAKADKTEQPDDAAPPQTKAKGIGGIGSAGGAGAIGGGASASPREAAEKRADKMIEQMPNLPNPSETPTVRDLPPSAGVGAAKPKAASKRKVQEIDLVALREAGYITPDMPPNLMSEEFRIIKRSILLSAFSKGDKRVDNGNVVLVTSSNPGEGKSFCAINLALSIATEQDTTVLLIDADFSKPEVLNRLGVSGGRGLMDVVADENMDVGDCLIRTNIPNLVLLPAGRQHNLTTELLASERMEKIAKEIGSRYPDRLVIFDSPPVLASSAASVLALYMGQIVFVIEAEKTTEPQIKESLSMISACDHISLLLNKTRYSGSNKKFATYYGYGGR